MTTYVPTNKHTLKRMNSKTTFSVEAIRMLAWPWPAHACPLIHPSVCLEALEGPIRFFYNFQLVFSARTVFFSHNKSAGIMFRFVFSAKRTGPKPVGTVLLQWLRMRLRSTGRLSLMPRTSPLMAVQRQSAASRSTRPSSSVQHGSVGGTPTLALMRPSKLAHTPSLSAL